jgi:hypothetical protein
MHRGAALTRTRGTASSDNRRSMQAAVQGIKKSVVPNDALANAPTVSDLLSPVRVIMQAAGCHNRSCNAFQVSKVQGSSVMAGLSGWRNRQSLQKFSQRYWCV